MIIFIAATCLIIHILSFRFCISFKLSLNTNTMFNPYSEFPFLWIRLSKGTQFRITFMEVLQHLGYHENIAHSPWCSVICLCNSVYLLIGHHSSIFNPLIWSVFTLCSLISSTVWILFLIYNISPKQIFIDPCNSIWFQSIFGS